MATKIQRPMGQQAENTESPAAQSASSAPTPVLEHPPIAEVVCGWVFEPLSLDGMLLGVYWDERKEDFPKRSLQPPVVDGPAVILVQSNARAMLESAAGDHLIQAQHDRFFFNWRGPREEYPRFSPSEGRPALLGRALAEFDRFAGFCERRAGRRPTVKRLELTKVDVLHRGQDWSDLDDLASLVPLTGTFGPVQEHGRREIALRFVERRERETLVVSLHSLLNEAGGDTTALQIETRVIRQFPPDESYESGLRSANNAANRVFFKLIPKPDRFGIVSEGTQ